MEYFYHSCFRFTSSINKNIVKQDWLKKIDWMIKKNRNIKLKTEMRKVYEDQLIKIEQRFEERSREIELDHDKQRQEILHKSNSELASMLIGDYQRQKIQKLIVSQFEEIFKHNTERFKEIMQIEKEEIEKRINIINDELREIVEK